MIECFWFETRGPEGRRGEGEGRDRLKVEEIVLELVNSRVVRREGSEGGYCECFRAELGSDGSSD